LGSNWVGFSLRIIGGAVEKLLFVDANIWLDFYRPRQSDVAPALLKKLEGLVDRIIVTHVLEMEYKKNRQAAILQGLNELKSPPKLTMLGIFSEGKAPLAIAKSHAAIEKRLAQLRSRLRKALTHPAQRDPVYKTCQRIFGRQSELVLGLGNDMRRLRRIIHEKATRRFLLGCPPRKDRETSIGDAVNWEWMVHCAEEHDAELVILTRDQDYGPQFDNNLLLNDHLNQEFKERVSRKRSVLLYKSAALALKHFDVKVPKEVVKGEMKFITSTTPSSTSSAAGAKKVDLAALFRELAHEVEDRPPEEDEDSWLDIDGAPRGVSKPEDFSIVEADDDAGAESDDNE
jgi:hypothetical protein